MFTWGAVCGFIGCIVLLVVVMGLLIRKDDRMKAKKGQVLVEFVEGADGQWTIKVWGANAKQVLSLHPETYHNLRDAEDMLELIRHGAMEVTYTYADGHKTRTVRGKGA